jgi:uncharacterized membrane protein (UPF0127 family)
MLTAVAAPSLGACSGSSALVLPSGPAQSAVVFGGGRSNPEELLRVYEATTAAARAQGLMGVRSLPDDVGMAFVWGSPTTSGFWMKDTLIPLSIAFVSADDRIVSIQDMTPCTAEPCHVYRSPSPYVMAVEANQGWFTQRFIKVGDEARLESRNCTPNPTVSCVTPSV